MTFSFSSKVDRRRGHAMALNEAKVELNLDRPAVGGLEEGACHSIE